MWRACAGQFLFQFEDIMIPALQLADGAVPEATVLLSALRDISVICSKSRADLKPHHCLHAKLSSFAFSRTVRAPSCCVTTARVAQTTQNGTRAWDGPAAVTHRTVLVAGREPGPPLVL